MTSYFLLSSIGLLLLCCCYYLFLKQDTFFQQNRMTLLLGVIASLILPLFDVLSISHQQVITEFVPTVYLPALHVGEKPTEVSVFPTLSEVVIGTYWMIAGVLLLRLLLTNAKLLSYVFTKQKAYIGSRQVVSTNGEYPTFAYLKYIFWDNTKQLSSKEKELLLCHETAHIEEWHALDVLIMELLKVFFWFHPAVYLIDVALRTQHEYLADKKANNLTNDASYRQLMVRSLFEELSISVGNGFQFLTVKKRMKMLKKERSPQWKRAKSIVAIGLLFSSVAVFDACVKENEEVVEVTADISHEIIDIPADGIYDKVETSASPKGGLPALYKAMGKLIRYPDDAKKEGIQGKVYVQFVVDETGSATDIKVIKGVHSSLDKESIKAIAELVKDWSPAQLKDGTIVKQRMVLPIGFRLPNLD